MKGHINFASSSEDEFPDLDVIFERSKQAKLISKTSVQDATDKQHEPPKRTTGRSKGSETLDKKDSGIGRLDDTTVPSTVRRRKLGQQSNNPLLKPFGAVGRNEGQSLIEVPEKTKRISSVRVRELPMRSRVTPPANPPSHEMDDQSEDSSHEATEITEADISEFFGDSPSESEGDDTPAGFGQAEPTSKSRRLPSKQSQRDEGRGAKDCISTTRRALELDFPTSNASVAEIPRRRPAGKEGTAERSLGRNATQPKSTLVDLTDDMTDALRQLDLTSRDSKGDKKNQERNGPRVTPPSTPPRQSSKTLVSPKKLPAIPMTPHGPSMDLFWSQEFVDEWNEEHSPKKLILPPAQKSPAKSPVKVKDGKMEATNQKEAKKSFEKRKHEVAQAFLQELDDTITQGKLQSLAESTGGIKINWSSKLNTTAGRANWRRETIRSKLPDGTEKSATHRHHASIELAEKVIDDENRLLNVVAHEFCHLANFMVNGITGNPHGKEFKVWAAECSQAFGDRGIEVTTKHSYEIDFKYIWECTECGLEYKRHSKSVNPERHRCGSCKALLKQTKPVPRAVGKPSEYQKFFKEQMKVVREEHPKSPQKEVMKIIADRWAKRGGSSRATPESDQSVSISEASVGKIGARLNSLSL